MKRITLSEQNFKYLLSLMINESNAPIFGKGKYTVDYSPIFKELQKIENLHTDRYKDYELEEAYENWENTNFDKNSDEYLIYLSKFKNFIFGSQGLARNLSYVADRIKGPLHTAILDNQWSASLIRTKDWKYSDTSSNFGGDEFHCFYTTILKIYQNPAIWNDFFFNPAFSELKQKYDNIKTKLINVLKTDMALYNTSYKPLLPLEEYKQLNLFSNKKENAKPELFYDPQYGSNHSFVDDSDEDF